MSKDRAATLKGFARILGESVDAVTHLRNTGRLVLAEDGKRIMVDASIAAMRQSPPAPPARIASLSRFARILDCQPSYVTQLKDAGRLVLTSDGMVDVDASLALINQTADPSKDGVAARHAAKRGRGQPPAAPDAGDDSERDDGPDTFEPPSSDSRRKAKALADAAEADARKKLRDEQVELGSLLARDDVVPACANAVATLRNGLENLSNTLAPELAAETDEGKVRVILADAIEHALDELSRQFAAIGKVEVET